MVISSISGVSGAGRKMKTEYHFSEAHANVKAYKLADHQHLPEMEQELSAASGFKVTISFNPHLGPYNRGILTTAILDLARKIDTERALSVYSKFYAGEKFVNVLPEGVLPEVKNVCGTNRIDIGMKVDSRLGKLILVSAIDNLVKGASGQAVQNMNLMLGLPEETGLMDIGQMP
jgi:N-acetyl-gamma-glutamyl-phosphate reductase